MLGRGAVERGSQPGDNIIVIPFGGPILPKGRHLPGAKFSDDLFPFIRMLSQFVLGDAFEIQVALLRFAVVTLDAVLVHDRSDHRGQRRCCSPLRRRNGGMIDEQCRQC